MMKQLSILALFLLLFAACKQASDDLVSPTDDLITSADDLISPDGGFVVSRSPKTTRVFKGTFNTTLDTNPAIPPTACSGDIPGLAIPGYFFDGHATHMGKLIPELSRGQDVTCDLSLATMLLNTSVSGQFAAANGDLVFYTGNDVIDVTNFITGSGPTGPINGTWTITGGTGRFEGASGSFTISGYVDFATLTLHFDANGTIVY